MSSAVLIIKTFISVLETRAKLDRHGWEAVTQDLGQQHHFAQKLNPLQRELVFKWARRFCRILRFRNGCLICTLVLLKLDTSPAKMFLGILEQAEAHAWLLCEDVVYTTDRNLPKDANIVFERSVSL